MSFFLRDGRLFRKLQRDMLARYAVCTYGVFKCIKVTHLQLGHVGISKTCIVLRGGTTVSRREVAWLLYNYRNRIIKQPNLPHLLLTPIVSFILGHIQVNLLDFHSGLDKEYEWIWYIKNHFSKFASLLLLRCKEAREVTVRPASTDRLFWCSKYFAV